MADKFVALLPAGAQKVVKALAPFVLNLVYAGATLIATGGYDKNDVKINAVGLLGAVLTYVLPNKTKK